MPPSDQTPRYYETPFNHGDQLDLHQSELDLLTNEALNTYSPDRVNHDVSAPLGASAAGNARELDAHEIAESFEELPALTLGQFTHNIIAMRSDAVKPVNGPIELRQDTSSRPLERV